MNNKDNPCLQIVEEKAYKNKKSWEYTQQDVWDSLEDEHKMIIDSENIRRIKVLALTISILAIIVAIIITSILTGTIIYVLIALPVLAILVVIGVPLYEALDNWL